MNFNNGKKSEYTSIEDMSPFERDVLKQMMGEGVSDEELLQEHNKSQEYIEHAVKMSDPNEAFKEEVEKIKKQKKYYGLNSKVTYNDKSGMLRIDDSVIKVSFMNSFKKEKITLNTFEETYSPKILFDKFYGVSVGQQVVKNTFDTLCIALDNNQRCIIYDSTVIVDTLDYLEQYKTTSGGYDFGYPYLDKSSESSFGLYKVYNDLASVGLVHGIDIQHAGGHNSNWYFIDNIQKVFELLEEHFL